MPLCDDVHKTEEIYIPDKDIFLRKNICTIYMVGEGERILHGGPALTSYTLSQRNLKTLKNVYVKLKNVYIGTFTTGPRGGIYVEEIPLPNPFKWEITWPSLEKLINENAEELIRKEFRVNIRNYLYLNSNH